MVITDPIADMLTRIRNANKMRHEVVSMPSSKIKLEIARVLKQEGFIRDFEFVDTDDKQGLINVTLKYVNKERVIKGLKRISKPGLRVTQTADKLPKVLNGLGIAILSTSSGIMTDHEARAKHVGGEILAFVW